MEDARPSLSSRDVMPCEALARQALIKPVAPDCCDDVTAMGAVAAAGAGEGEVGKADVAGAATGVVGEAAGLAARGASAGATGVVGDGVVRGGARGVCSGGGPDGGRGLGTPVEDGEGKEGRPPVDRDTRTSSDGDPIG